MSCSFQDAARCPLPAKARMVGLLRAAPIDKYQTEPEAEKIRLSCARVVLGL